MRKNGRESYREAVSSIIKYHKLPQIQICRCNHNSGENTDIIIYGCQVKKILNLIILKSSTSNSNLILINPVYLFGCACLSGGYLKDGLTCKLNSAIGFLGHRLLNSFPETSTLDRVLTKFSVFEGRWPSFVS
jgi:hypothetical protein